MANTADYSRKRVSGEGAMPLVDISGSARDCGRELGYRWRNALVCMARDAAKLGLKPWWRAGVQKKLMENSAPHLADIYLGMAAGAGLKESEVGFQFTPSNDTGCTSFAVAPSATLDGIPVSGQTKDTSRDRIFYYQILRLRLDDAPAALTLTYPGWLFGHGFVRGGCSVFRNSLYVEPSETGIAYEAWGCLALHCQTAAEAVEMAKKHGIAGSGHCTVADEDGGILGMEYGAAGVKTLKPKRGVYAHANHAESGKAMAGRSTYAEKELAVSRRRSERLRARLRAERGRLTAQLAWMALADHEGYPCCVCRHAGKGLTTAAVVAEPTRGRLAVSRGCPCSHWPQVVEL